MSTKKFALAASPLLSAMVVGMLESQVPAIRDAYNAVKTAEGLKRDVTNARTEAADELEAAGLADGGVWNAVKRAAVAAARVDNGPGNPRGIDGKTFADYFMTKAATDGLPDNTGKAYANRGGRIVNAVVAGPEHGGLDGDYVLSDEFTNTVAQRFFAEDDAKARTDVKAKLADMVKGTSADYCSQLSKFLDGFEYVRPEREAEGYVNGRRPPKEQKALKPDATAGARVH